MKVETAIFEIRNKINDRDEIGLDDEELLSYLNEALQYISAYLISANSPILIKTETINEGGFVLPDNFARFAGYFPVRVEGNIGELLDEPPVKVRYFVTADKVKATSTMPFTQLALNQVAIKLASIYAQNQQSLNIQQDKALLDEINGAIAGAISSAK